MFAQIVVFWTLLLQWADQTLILTQIKSFSPNISYIDFAADRIITSYTSSPAWNLQLFDLNNVTRNETSIKQISQPQINSADNTSDLVYMYIIEGKQIYIKQHPFPLATTSNISSSFPIQKLFFKFKPNYFYSYHDTGKNQWHIQMNDLDNLTNSSQIKYEDSNSTLRDFVVGKQFVYSIIDNSSSGILLYRHNRSNVDDFTLYHNLTFPNNLSTLKVSVSPNEKYFCAYTQQRLIYGNFHNSTDIRHVDSLGPISRIYEVVMCDDYTLIVLHRSPYTICELRLHKNEDQNQTKIKRINIACDSFSKIFCDPAESFKLYTLNKLYSVKYLDENITTDNQTVNDTNDTTQETNTTNNTTQEIQEQIVEEDPPIDETTEAAVQFFKNEQVSQSMQTTASVMPIASMVGKNLLKFVNVGIDMFWMYNFHQENYTRFLTVLTDQLDVMAELRMKPNFLNIFDGIKAQAINSFNESNQNYRNLGNFHYKVPHDIYFLKTSFDTYTTNLLLNLFTFGIMVAIRHLSGLLRLKLGIFNLLYEYCLINTRWWMLLICLVQGNLSYLTFYACLQIQVPFFSTFTDKVNICLTVFVFLILIIQSLMFYPMLYALEKKSFSENILDVQNFNFKGFLLVMTMNSISNFGRSVFHGLFINQNMIQLIGLTSTNMVIVLICIIVRKEFRNPLLFLVTLLVYLIGTCFDFFLILQLTDSRKYQYETVITIVSLSFIAASFLKTVLIIACDLFALIKELCQSNQVADADQKHRIEICQLVSEHEPNQLSKKKDPPQLTKQDSPLNQVFINELPGWDYEKGEIGRGSLFNSNWPKDTIVADLDVNKNCPYNLPLEVEAGEYYLEFNWAVTQSKSLETSQIEIRWNGEYFLTLRAYSNSIHEESMVLKVEGTGNYVTFMGADTSDSYGATITNVQVRKIDMPPYSVREYAIFPFRLWGFASFLSQKQKNLVKNGDFQVYGFILTSTMIVQSRQVGYWQVRPYGELGFGQQYNSNWEVNNTVAVLDTVTNSVYNSSFIGHRTIYYLSYDYAAIETKPLQTSEYSVYFNGQEVLKMTPSDYSVRRQIVKVYGVSGENLLTFKGEGPSDQVGVAIDSVEVHERK